MAIGARDFIDKLLVGLQNMSVRKKLHKSVNPHIYNIILVWLYTFFMGMKTTI